MSEDVLRGICADRYRVEKILGIVAIAVMASAAALIPDLTSSREIGPKLTHTITRGDLLVTVSQQGTVESSHNTEIK